MTEYTLKPLYSDEILSFSWDMKTGEISGPGKTVIEKLMEKGEIITPPPSPKLYTIPEKITDTDMMSLLLGCDWEIPDDWADFYGQRAPKNAIF